MDLVEIVKALPKESINDITKVACNTFRDIVYPITAATKGLGLLIETKFDLLNDAQKILAAEAIRKTAEKASNNGRLSQSKSMKPVIFYEALDNIDAHVDQLQSEVWTNLMASEVQTGNIHPEIVRTLSKLASGDILLLNDIAFNQDKDGFSRFIAHFKKDNATLTPVRNSFNHFYLEELGVIVKHEGKWNTTFKGVELLRSVQSL
ncbi:MULTISPECIES: hypothetical protein [unclassified Halomonas]|uniref:hypothetical protein n=1 Tax=unclassified Halomonas TaxID=2609666 RepID=UPI0009906DA1|nr:MULTISPECIES: hypothetical protein [unclassified Halomonas]AQU82655.1 hypothetical protein B2G49_08590 [Halomonas sp. 'Soap Lake \